VEHHHVGLLRVVNRELPGQEVDGLAPYLEIDLQGEEFIVAAPFICDRRADHQRLSDAADDAAELSEAENEHEEPVQGEPVAASLDARARHLGHGAERGLAR